MGLKAKKTEDCKPSWEKPGFSGAGGEKKDEGKARAPEPRRDEGRRNDRDDDSPRERRKDDSPRIQKLASPKNSGARDEPRTTGDYGLFDADDRAGLRSDSDSDSDRGAAAPKTLQKPPGMKAAAPASDLLDMFDAPAAAAPPAATPNGGGGDWNAFGDAAPAAAPDMFAAPA